VKNMERRHFIGSLLGLSGAASLGFRRFKRSGISTRNPDYSEKTIRLKGKQDSLVIHWDIITIGNLSRNRYWGESDDHAVRSAICTCTVVSGKDFCIIVDPSIENESAMTTELNRRTGLTPEKIDAVFITHQHGDHLAGLKCFPKSRWLAGYEVASELNKNGLLPKQIEPAGNSLFETINVIKTPGHTPHHRSLHFDHNGFSIVIAGDSVATKDYWDKRQMYYNVIDPEESKRTMEKINSIADIIVPGHDNYFLNL